MNDDNTPVVKSLSIQREREGKMDRITIAQISRLAQLHCVAIASHIDAR